MARANSHVPVSSGCVTHVPEQACGRPLVLWASSLGPVQRGGYGHVCSLACPRLATRSAGGRQNGMASGGMCVMAVWSGTMSSPRAARLTAGTLSFRRPVIGKSKSQGEAAFQECGNWLPL